MEDLDNDQWSSYIKECHTKGTQPDVSDFRVWLQEQDFDEDEPDREAADVA